MNLSKQIALLLGNHETTLILNKIVFAISNRKSDVTSDAILSIKAL